MSTRRRRSPRTAPSMAGEEARRIFVEEYRFLRGANMSHESIARRLGITVATLRTRILRYDCLILSPAEQSISDRLDALIEHGESFTLEQVSPLDDGTAIWLVGIAIKRGRIRSSRTRAPGPKHPSVYTPIRSQP